MRTYARKLIALLLAVCLLAGVMPVAMAIDWSDVPTKSPIELEITAKRAEGGFEMLYQAVTWINAEQVKLVLANRNKVSRLEELEFSCRLNDEAIDLLPKGSTLPSFYFSSVQVGPQKDELFIPLRDPAVWDHSEYLEDGSSKHTHWIHIDYKLNPKVVEEVFPTLSDAELKDALMRPMGMSLHTDMPEFLPDGSLTDVDTLHTHAIIYLSNWDYGKLFTMAEGEMETDIRIPTRSVRTALKQDSAPFMEGYPDETFKPDGAITRAEVAQVLSRRLDAPARRAAVSFPDVDSGAWYAKAVSELAGLGYLKGDANGNFRPDAPITRAEMAALLVRFAEGEADAAASFSDVPATHWAYDAINTAAAYGWVNGVGEGRFSPDRPITRAEAAKLFCVVLGRNLDKVAIAMGMGRAFADVSADHWAYPYIADVSTARESVKLGSFEIWTAAK